MVEEMYKEEMKDPEQGNADEQTSETDVKEDSSSKSNSSPTRTDQGYPQPLSLTNVNSHRYAKGDDNLFMQSNLKKARSEESMNIGSHEHNNYSFITGSTSHGGGFGEYSVGEIERFGLEQFAPRLSGSGVSLTLGLTQYGNLSLSGAQPSYISSNGIENNGFSGIDNNQFRVENMSIESRKRFAAQLLPDFVA